MSSASSAEASTAMTESSTQPAAKRPRHELPSSDALLLNRVLYAEGHRKVISSYLTVSELVSLRRVSPMWLTLLSEACCWEKSLFAPSVLQLTLQGDAIQLSTMPHLKELHLRSYDYPKTGPTDATIDRLMLQLAAGSNTALTKLIVDANADTAVLRALPHLEELQAIPGARWKPGMQWIAGQHRGSLTGSVDELQHMSKKLHKLHVMFDSADEQMLTALTRVAPAGVTHYGQIAAAQDTLKSFIAAVAPQLETITITVDYKPIITTINNLLTCSRLTALVLNQAKCDDGLMSALIALPHLTKLVAHMADLDEAFLQRIPELRSAMISHLPANKQAEQEQHLELRFPSIARLGHQLHADWWLAALRASFYCTELVLQQILPQQHIWQQFAAECAANPPSSMLQTVRARPVQGKLWAIHDFVQLHASITKLSIMPTDKINRTEDKRFLHTLSSLPNVTALDLPYVPPTTLSAALTVSGALSKLTKLSVCIDNGQNAPSFTALWQTLSTIRDATSLETVYLRTHINQWQHTEADQAQSYTKHLKDLRIIVNITSKTLTAAKAERVVEILLLQSPLMQLSIRGKAFQDLRATGVLSDQEMVDFRRTAGMNSVNIMCME